MKPTLFLLAAGMGSRYGGLKQFRGAVPHPDSFEIRRSCALRALLPGYRRPARGI